MMAMQDERDSIMERNIQSAVDRAAADFAGCSDRDHSTLMFWWLRREFRQDLGRNIQGLTSGLPCTNKTCPIFENGNGNGKKKQAKDYITIALPKAFWLAVIAAVVALFERIWK